jgi:hypothetical protein
MSRSSTVHIGQTYSSALTVPVSRAQKLNALIATPLAIRRLQITLSSECASARSRRPAMEPGPQLGNHARAGQVDRATSRGGGQARTGRVYSLAVNTESAS